MDRITDDIVLRSAMDRANGDHRRFERRHFARHQRLQRNDDLRRQIDRVLRCMRIGAVPPDAVNFDIDRINIRHRIARRIMDLAGRDASKGME